MPTTSPTTVLPSAVFVPDSPSGAALPALPAATPASVALFRAVARTTVLLGLGLGVAFVVVLARLG